MAWTGLQYSTTFTATTALGSVSYVSPASSTLVLKANRVTIVNTGTSSAICFNFTTTTGATTGDYAVGAGSTFTITTSRGYFTGLSYIAAGAGASVVCNLTAIRS